MCDGMCPACPFDLFGEYSNKIQNYGCLPTPQELMRLKRDKNLNWECHDVEGKKCVGFIQHAKDLGLNYKVGDMATLEQWDKGLLD